MSPMHTLPAAAETARRLSVALASTAPGAAVQMSGVSKDHPGGVRALDSVTVGVAPGEFLAVTGASGSGKSTLMHLAAGLDVPTTGRVHLAGHEVSALGETARTEIRRRAAGFVFQAYNLLPWLTVADNITLPLRLAGLDPDPAWVDELVARVGLADRVHHRPAELSGGEQQRAAVARALVSRPTVVFADEPTGALDLRSSRALLELLAESARTFGQTVVMVTHDPAAAAWASRVLVMHGGRLVEDLTAPSADAVTRHLLSVTAG